MARKEKTIARAIGYSEGEINFIPRSPMQAILTAQKDLFRLILPGTELNQTLGEMWCMELGRSLLCAVISVHCHVMHDYLTK